MWIKPRTKLIELVHRASGSYKVWVIHTVEDVGIYRWEKWKELLPMITALLSITQEHAYLRTTQFNEHESKRLGFGRMRWNEENNRKWTTKYLEDRSQSGTVVFFNTEIWAPDWNSYDSDGKPPHVYVNLFKEHGSDGLFEGLVIAIPTYLFHRHQALVLSEVEKIRLCVPSSGVSSIVRGWRGKVAVGNAIMDLNRGEIRKIIGVGTRA